MNIDLLNMHIECRYRNNCEIKSLPMYSHYHCVSGIDRTLLAAVIEGLCELFRFPYWIKKIRPLSGSGLYTFESNTA